MAAGTLGVGDLRAARLRTETTCIEATTTAAPPTQAETFEPDQFRSSSFLNSAEATGVVVEVGPRLTFESAWSSNALSILRACGVGCVKRLERSRRYLIRSSVALSAAELAAATAKIHDRMTECVFAQPLRCAQRCRVG